MANRRSKGGGVVPGDLVRPVVRGLHAYVPGEQPKIAGLVKLNTNENPYPPSPRVLAAVRKAVDGRLRLYPNPTSQALRERLAGLHGCGVENVLVGNGSDELLAMAVRAFVEPGPFTAGCPAEAGAAAGDMRSPKKAVRDTQELVPPSRSVVQYLVPSYSLYPVLADMHGARRVEVPLGEGFGLPTVAALRRGGRWDFGCALSFVTTPNAPTGRGYSREELRRLCEVQRGVVVLDEAYVDFAEEDALGLALEMPHVLVSRTFSKAYSLCFQRVGYMVGHPELIQALDKIRDSYNVNGLGQVAALATLDDLGYYRGNFRKILATRARVGRELGRLGFEVLPSQTNFLFARPPGPPAERWLALLRDRKVLVRWFAAPGIRDFLRITIGSEAEMEEFLAAVQEVLEGGTR